MDWICGFLTGSITGCILGLTLDRSSEKITLTVNERSPSDRPLEAERDLAGGTQNEKF